MMPMGLDFVLRRGKILDMKRFTAIIMTVGMLLGCAPVLSRGLMRQGVRDISLNQVRENPGSFKGRLFILGGVIVETRLTEKGSMIELLAVPVDSYGSLKFRAISEGRAMALYPKAKGILDPAIYRKGREITFAGTFMDVQKGRIDEMEYLYPVFEIQEIYLWEERTEYYVYPYPWYYRYPPWWYDPWWYEPWWRLQPDPRP